jgi:RHS repeat-associated protein
VPLNRATERPFDRRRHVSPVGIGAGLGRVETTDSWFDPQVEFLEIATVQTSGNATSGVQWKVYGPDKSGAYGGVQGVGGLEAVIGIGNASATPIVPNTISAVWSDMLGHVEAYTIPANISSGSATPGNVTPQSRSSGYGLLPGEAAVDRWSQTDATGTTTNLAATLAWQGRRMDASGYYSIGAREYNPVAGRFLSPDPLGQSASWDLYSYAGGDPINNIDCTGRSLVQAIQNLSLRPPTGQNTDTPIISGVTWTTPQTPVLGSPNIPSAPPQLTPYGAGIQASTDLSQTPSSTLSVGGSGTLFVPNPTSMLGVGVTGGGSVGVVYDGNLFDTRIQATVSVSPEAGAGAAAYAGVGYSYTESSSTPEPGGSTDWAYHGEAGYGTPVVASGSFDYKPSQSVSVSPPTSQGKITLPVQGGIAFYAAVGVTGSASWTSPSIGSILGSIFGGGGNPSNAATPFTISGTVTATVNH